MTDKEIMTKEAWVVWRNTDRTEGRGGVYAYAICEYPETAKRMGKGQDVQGCDCRIEKIELTWNSSYRKWDGPVSIEQENSVDNLIRVKREAKEVKMKKIQELLAPLYEQAGVSREQINEILKLQNELNDSTDLE